MLVELLQHVGHSLHLPLQLRPVPYAIIITIIIIIIVSAILILILIRIRILIVVGSARCFSPWCSLSLCSTMTLLLLLSEYHHGLRSESSCIVWSCIVLVLNLFCSPWEYSGCA